VTPKVQVANANAWSNLQYLFKWKTSSPVFHISGDITQRWSEERVWHCILYLSDSTTCSHSVSL